MKCLAGIRGELTRVRGELTAVLVAVCHSAGINVEPVFSEE